MFLQVNVLSGGGRAAGPGACMSDLGGAAQTHDLGGAGTSSSGWLLSERSGEGGREAGAPRVDLRWARLLRLAVVTRVLRLVRGQLLACSSAATVAGAAAKVGAQQVAQQVGVRWAHLLCLAVVARELLAAIASGDSSAREAVILDGAVESLVRALDPSSPLRSSKAREVALRAIDAVCLAPPASTDRLLAAGFLDPVLSLLRSGDTTLQHCALKAAHRLCQVSEEVRKAMGDAGFMPELVGALHAAKSPEAREMAAEALCSLVSVQRNRKPTPAKRFLLSTLMHLTDSSSGRRKIMSSELVSSLEKLAETNVHVVRYGGLREAESWAGLAPFPPDSVWYFYCIDSGLDLAHLCKSILKGRTKAARPIKFGAFNLEDSEDAEDEADSLQQVSRGGRTCNRNAEEKAGNVELNSLAMSECETSTNIEYRLEGADGVDSFCSLSLRGDAVVILLI